MRPRRRAIELVPSRNSANQPAPHKAGFLLGTSKCQRSIRSGTSDARNTFATSQQGEIGLHGFAASATGRP